jgi:hypothetical protein
VRGHLNPLATAATLPTSASRRPFFTSAAFKAKRYSEIDFGCNMECDVSDNVARDSPRRRFGSLPYPADPPARKRMAHRRPIAKQIP